MIQSMLRPPALAPLGALFLTLGGPLQAQSADGSKDTALRYGRIARDGAVVRNLAGKTGVEITRPAKGTLVTVHREAAGWLEVEMPGGMPVWVFGRYLQPTEEADVFEVTKNAVNIRPRPSSAVNSFPLPQRLHAGDRVRLIELENPGEELAESWAKVWSPPGVRGFLSATDFVSLAKGEAGDALWEAALGELAGRLPQEKKVIEAKAQETQAREQASEALLRARDLLEAETNKQQPDYQSVRDALNAVLALNPSGPTAVEARHQLQVVDFHEEAQALRDELTEQQERQAEQYEERKRDVVERSRAKDPLGAIFQERGVLVRQLSTDGVPRFFVRFGGETTAELVCASGRYDLDVFSGFEVGVQGSELLGLEGAGSLPVLEVRRIEVLAGR